MFGWARDRYDNADPTLRLVGIAAFVLLLVFGLPRVLPISTSGVACSGLASPALDGNNQSLLADQADSSGLVLELIPDKTVLAVGEPLTLYVRFINASMAPVSLFLVENEIPFRFTGQEAGLQFAVVTINREPRGESANVRPVVPPRQQFNNREVRLLQPRSRCTVTVTLTPQRLAQAGLNVIGDYQITAVYNNNFPGALPNILPLTPTPIFPDQGVWTGELQSNTILISISQVVPPQ
jgi:hypothetical protein